MGSLQSDTCRRSEGGQLDISLSTMEEGGYEVKFLCVQLLKGLPNHVQHVSFIQQIGASTVIQLETK